MKYWLNLLLLFATISAFAFQLDNYHFPNAPSPLDIPTYIEDNYETCHPDVHYFPSSWNGWHYWMCHTPYPNTVAQFENPSIVVSNDGINWQEPDGIQNPVADVYTGTDHNNYYNSDNHIVMSPDGETMHLIWRRKNGWNNELIQMKSSTDGISWGETTTLLSVWGTDPLLNETALSPCVVYNGTGYLMWTVNTKVSPRSVYLRFSQQLGFSNSTPILTDIGEFPEGYRLWHMDIDYIDGYYHILASVGSANNQEGKVLYLGKSLNGINWEFSQSPVMSGTQGNWDARLYRSAFLRTASGQGYKVWYGSMNHPQWRIGYTEAEPNGFLPAPLDFAVNSLGEDQYQLSFSSPADDIAGYELYLNHQFHTLLNAEADSYHITLSENALFEDKRVFALKGIWEDGKRSDPVSIRIAASSSNPGSPALVSQLSAYPNPFGSSIQVQGKDLPAGELKLYNLKGQLLLREHFNKSLDWHLPADLPTGIYFLRYQAPGARPESLKLLKLN